MTSDRNCWATEPGEKRKSQEIILAIMIFDTYQSHSGSTVQNSFFILCFISSTNFFSGVLRISFNNRKQKDKCLNF